MRKPNSFIPILVSIVLIAVLSGTIWTFKGRENWEKTRIQMMYAAMQYVPFYADYGDFVEAYLEKMDFESAYKEERDIEKYNALGKMLLEPQIDYDSIKFDSAAFDKGKPAKLSREFQVDGISYVESYLCQKKQGRKYDVIRHIVKEKDSGEKLIDQKSGVSPLLDTYCNGGIVDEYYYQADTSLANGTYRRGKDVAPGDYYLDGNPEEKYLRFYEDGTFSRSKNLKKRIRYLSSEEMDWETEQRSFFIYYDYLKDFDGYLGGKQYPYDGDKKVGRYIRLE